MARACTVCASENVPLMDSDLRSGASFAAVAQKYKTSESAVRRHMRNHLERGSLLALAGSHDATTGDLLGALLTSLGQAQAVQKSALRAGREPAVLRAAAVVESTVRTLLTGFGVDDAAIVDDLRSAERMSIAIVRTLKLHPEIGATFAAELDKAGAADLAQDVRNNFIPGLRAVS